MLYGILVGWGVFALAFIVKMVFGPEFLIGFILFVAVTVISAMCGDIFSKKNRC